MSIDQPYQDESSLLTALQRDEPAAYRQVYGSYMPQLCFFVERVTGDTITSNDIVAEAFIKTFQKKAHFPDLQKFKAYLFVSAGNAAKNYIKSRKHHEAVHHQLGQEYERQTEDIEVAYLRSEALQILREEITRLPSPVRQVVWLSFVEGKSITEIAEELNMAYKTVQNQKTKGIKLLRTSILKNALLTAEVLGVVLSMIEFHP